MKIAVNTRLLLPYRMDGIAWFTAESFRRIVQQHPEYEFHFLFDRSYAKEFLFADNVVPHVVLPQARRPFLFKLWYDYTVPNTLKRINPKLFISPDAMLSLRTEVPQLLVMHDLNFEHYPHDLPQMYSRYLRKRSPLFAAKAARIATVSEYSKQDIVERYSISPEKIDVVYNGAAEVYKPIDEATKRATRQRYSGGKPYFIFVSSIHPRKNLQRLLPAFDNFKNETGSETQLVVVGKKFWFNSEIEQAYMGMKHRESVLFTGHMQQSELHRLVASATASVYPSYFEGFGIPVLEAMQSGVPVITSSHTSLPEVAGDAVQYIDPFSIESIKHALTEIERNAELRARLAALGLQRAQLFSWQRTADLLWNSIEKTLYA